MAMVAKAQVMVEDGVEKDGGGHVELEDSVDKAARLDSETRRHDPV